MDINQRVRLKKRGKELMIMLALLPGVVMVFFPIYITVISAFKTAQESNTAFFAFPTSLFLDNFVSVIESNNYFLYIANTTVIMLVTITLEVIITPIAAYAIQRNINRKYFKFLYAFIVCGLFIPFQVRMVSLVQMTDKMGLMNRAGMVILYLAGTSSQAIFLVVAYLKSVPGEIEEAAIIDGCGPIQVYARVVFPLIKPVISTLVIKDSLFVWNDFMLPLVILNGDPNQWTLQLFQYNFKTQSYYNYNLAFASFLLSMLPIMILYVILQKNFVAGLANGAVKG